VNGEGEWSAIRYHYLHDPDVPAHGLGLGWRTRGAEIVATWCANKVERHVDRYQRGMIPRRPREAPPNGMMYVRHEEIHVHDAFDKRRARQILLGRLASGRHCVRFALSDLRAQHDLASGETGAVVVAFARGFGFDAAGEPEVPYAISKLARRWWHAHRGEL
jgi:hypothetical protein